MTYIPNLDSGENARILTGAVNSGVNMGATRRSLDMRQAEEDRTQQDWQRENAQRGASDEVWRTLATEYLMKGLDHEDLIADYMPDSPDGQRFRAMGKGARGPMMGGMGPSVEEGQGFAANPSAVGPFQDEALNSPQQGGVLPAAGGVPGGGVGGGGQGPPVDTAQLPGVMSQPAPSMMGGAGMQEHPDDTRLRRALQNADARTIQQALPYLKDEKKRRAFTRTLNHLIDEGIHDAVLTPHIKDLIVYYYNAGQPDEAMNVLEKAYDDQGRHEKAMELERLRQSGRLEGIDARGENTLRAIGARNAGAKDIADLRAQTTREQLEERAGYHDGLLNLGNRKAGESERSNLVNEGLGADRNDIARNKPASATGVVAAAKMAIEKAKTEKTSIERQYKGVNEALGGMGLTPPTDDEIERLRHPATTSYGDGISDMEEHDYNLLKAKVALWKKLIKAHQDLDAAYESGQKSATDAGKGGGSSAAPQLPGAAPETQAQIVQNIDALRAQGKTEDEIYEALKPKGR